MKCGSCVKKIETNLKQLDGVKEVSINLEEKKGKIIYNSEQISPQKLEQNINDLGFQTTLLSWL